MDYYNKYLKYKKKYLELKKQLGTGIGDKCLTNGVIDDTKCKKHEYCSNSWKTYGVCQLQKNEGEYCVRYNQCKSKLCNIYDRKCVKSIPNKNDKFELNDFGKYQNLP
jgi:hypothetical protein